MNIPNAKTRLNLFIRKTMRVLKLEANVNGMKEVKSNEIFNSISRKSNQLKFWKICDQANVNDETRIN